MTIAIDRSTGAKLGQVTSIYATTGFFVLLSRGGRYVTVPADSVRLEHVD